MKLNVLCIDDDPISRIIIQRMMEKIPFANQVFTAENGRDALDKIASMDAHPDLIFLDLDMPVLDGWGFLQIYNNLYNSVFPKTHVALLTSSVDPQDRVKAAEFSNVMDLYIKPVSVEMLQKIQQRIVELA